MHKNMTFLKYKICNCKPLLTYGVGFEYQDEIMQHLLDQLQAPGRMARAVAEKFTPTYFHMQWENDQRSFCKSFNGMCEARRAASG